MTDWEAIVGLLRGTPYQRGVVTSNTPSRVIEFDAGLTNAEIEQAEAVHKFRFPPDLRRFLQTALPVGDGFPNWRRPDAPELMTQVGWPKEGFDFDAQHNPDLLWRPVWGSGPSTQSERVVATLQRLEHAPRLIPVFAHRYISETPSQSGNPVFSIYQTDIILYGSDLETYFGREFNIAIASPLRDPRHIPFWSDYL